MLTKTRPVHQTTQTGNNRGRSSYLEYEYEGGSYHGWFEGYRALYPLRALRLCPLYVDLCCTDTLKNNGVGVNRRRRQLFCSANFSILRIGRIALSKWSPGVHLAVDFPILPPPYIFVVSHTCGVGSFLVTRKYIYMRESGEISNIFLTLLACHYLIVRGSVQCPRMCQFQ